ncbi:capsular biosynthesis protein [Mesorhizobium sp. NPDC059025]|uniref:capsular polysaccharide export protein, LipB/KpsS family n=1 Tax=unclassified Mesorhizobium TaxID=325217 RepID=UPI00366DA7FB
MAKSDTVAGSSRLINFSGRNTFRRRDRTYIAKNVPSKPLILMLQGPVGPFFSSFRRVLAAQGYNALKINFNGGDWLFSHGKHTLNFCGTTDSWADWLQTFVKGSRPLAIVLFGDSRPYHRTAIDVAKRLCVPVLCLEEGYSRPHFISCEWGGNNALSPLRYPPREVRLPSVEPDESIEGNVFRAIALDAIAYYALKSLGSLYFFGNAHHRNRGVFSEAVLWTRNFYRKLRYYFENNGFMMNLIENLDSQYFVVALQVHDDQQLIRHGKGWSMERLIAETIRSFAKSAEPTHHLVFKVHPMDRGHKSYRPFVKELARLSNCIERVHVIDDGSIGLIIRHSLGLVTVNSTSGLLALNHGKPVLALGDALYGMDKLATYPGNDPVAVLSWFWRFPMPPESECVRQFTARMHRESLVNGSFYLRAYIDGTCKRVLGHIQHIQETVSASAGAAMTSNTSNEGPSQVAPAAVGNPQ